MATLLEITGDDVALLNDADLRTLIGLLCEADYRSAGLSPKGIIWGGHQDASDGGLDVVVRSEFPPPKNSFIPRKTTGFQIKKPDMPRAKIKKEMMPKGVLRSAIKKLLHEQGAYIIVSSSGATTETALNDRIHAMRDVVLTEPNNSQLHLDFFDRGQIATWVRSHPPLILWVRNQIGRPLDGWQSFGNWANTPDGVQEEYLLDDELRLFDGAGSGDGDSVLDGLKKLRLRLSNDYASVRLIGLSGVGKTRLVQALFDDGVGDHALNPMLAYYTNISDNPIPDPVSFANQLILTQEKAILIVDNCSSELHRQLTVTCARSSVSLLTVEYDIQDDLPEETDVFRLEPASNELIEKLLEKRYAHISHINANTIAEFASGNARVAIALANTLKRGESLSTLRDEELFKRLFYQKHDPDEDLQISAEVCSLVYSFNGVDDSATSELEFLAHLADKSTRTLYRDTQELKNRGLIQSRSVWRALLPHAIANRLAKQALNSIPKTTIVDAFLTSGSERLIQSFTRRLSYLHDCRVAVEIANDWLKPDGWLGKTNCNFNSLGMTVFKNVAPVAPEAVLSMLERATSNNSGEAFIPEVDGNRREFIGLLQLLAYEPELFERSVRLLCKCALLERPDINDGNSARYVLKPLFHLFLSGTHALPQIRANIVNELVNSDVHSEAELGITLIEAALQTYHFHTTNTSSFGARSRDFGYQPKSNHDVCDWYERFIDICTRIALSDKPIASEVKRVFATNLRGLWLVGRNNGQDILEKLINSANQIHSKRAWNDGWVAVKGILRYDGKQMSIESLDKLKQFEQSLRPVNLLEQARTYALSDRRLSFDLEDDYDEGEKISSHLERIRRITREIGVEVIQEIDTFQAILPELVTCAYNNRLGIFGEGLGDGCVDRKSVWQILYTQLEMTPPKKRQFAVLLGYLSSCAGHDPDFYNTILDSLIEDEMLGSLFPHFQMTSIIDARGVERLHKSLDCGKVQISSFQYLTHESIDDDSLAALVQKIGTKEGGLFVAIEILKMRFHKSVDEPIDYSPKLLIVAREAISQYPYDRMINRHDQRSDDYDLAQIAKVCLKGKDGVDVVSKICLTLAEGLRRYRISTFNYPYLLGSLAHIHPYIFLDAFIGDEIEFQRMGFDYLKRGDNPITQIPENVLIDWCEREPETRYPALVSSLQVYWKPIEAEELSWNPIIFSILEKAPNIQTVLARLENTIEPMSWSGSYADTLEKRLVLFSALYDHKNPIIRNWAMEQCLKLQNTIKEQRAIEERENKKRFERFE
jgi:hypothetical protein